MKLAQLLKEANIEFGNGQSLAVTSATNAMHSFDKTGAKAQNYLKTDDLSKQGSATQANVRNVVEYLKGKGLWEKVATKQSFATTDLVFKSDGSCQVNFDDGGSIVIPRSIVTAVPKVQQQTFKDKFKKMVAASCKTGGKK